MGSAVRVALTCQFFKNKARQTGIISQLESHPKRLTSFRAAKDHYLHHQIRFLINHLVCKMKKKDKLKISQVEMTFPGLSSYCMFR